MSYLFVNPSFLSGVAKSIDLGGVYTSYNTSPSPEIADKVGLAMDWQVIANDIKDAMAEFQKKAKSI